MTKITTIDLDLAKRVFQVHGIDATGAVVLRKRLRREDVLVFFTQLPPCRIGMEACSTAHHWARELRALGHEVLLMPPQYVKPYVKRNKNDAADAEAICEAVRRPTMRFVAVKSSERQAVLVLHRTRELLVRQRTMLVNAIRAHCAEFALVSAQGVRHVSDLFKRAVHAPPTALPDLAKAAMALMAEQLETLEIQIQELNRRLLAWHKQDETSQRLATIPGVGVISATALAASVADPGEFRSGREFSASLGLVAASEFLRRQGPAWAYFQDGRSLLAQVAGGGRNIRRAPG